MTDLIGFPRTPHLFGEHSGKEPDDKYLSTRDSIELLKGQHVILTEKMDGSNIGISYPDAQLLIQSRKHELGLESGSEFLELQRWARYITDYKNQGISGLFERLEDRYTLYGEWLQKAHFIIYQSLSHYFLGFDVFDKTKNEFLDTSSRNALLEGLPVSFVPTIYEGEIKGLEHLLELINRPSMYEAHWRTAISDKPEEQTNLVEGVYGRIEQNGIVVSRFKFVNPQFREGINNLGVHHTKLPYIKNSLADEAILYN